MQLERRRVVGWCAASAAVALMFGLLLWLPSGLSADDNIRRDAALALGSGHGLFIKYSLMMSVLAVVPYRIGRMLGLGTWGLDNFVPLVWAAWALLMGARLVRLRDVKFAVGVVTLVTFSMLAAYVTHFNVEAFALLLVSYGALLALDDRRRDQVAGATLLAIGAACIPVQVLALGVVGLLMLRRRNVWFLVATAAAILATVVDATWSNGHFSISKYPVETFDYDGLLMWGKITDFGFPFVFGFVGLLLSFGRGLVWFTPGFFSRSVDTRDDVVRSWRRALTVLIVVMIPVYSKWWAWHAGFSYGSRFLLLAVVPAAVVVTERLQSSRRLGSWVVGVALALWSGWAAVAGSVFFLTPATNIMCRQNDFAYLPVCWYFSEYSPLLSPLWERWQVVAADVVMLIVSPVAMVALVWWLTPRSRWGELRASAVGITRSWRP